MISPHQARVWSRPPSAMPTAPSTPVPSRPATKAAALVQSHRPLTAEGVRGFGADFEEAFRRAEEEGLNVYAPAPTLTYGTGAKIGMLELPVDMRRLSVSLTKELSGKPPWNQSVIVDRDANEDLRTLETVARHRRENMMEGYFKALTQRERISRATVGLSLDDIDTSLEESIDAAAAVGFTSARLSKAFSEAAAQAAAVRREMDSTRSVVRKVPTSARKCQSPMCRAMKDAGEQLGGFRPRRPGRRRPDLSLVQHSRSSSCGGPSPPSGIVPRGLQEASRATRCSAKKGGPALM